jgi:hypothetical protein
MYITHNIYIYTQTHTHIYIYIHTYAELCRYILYVNTQWYRNVEHSAGISFLFGPPTTQSLTFPFDNLYLYCHAHPATQKLKHQDTALIWSYLRLVQYRITEDALTILQFLHPEYWTSCGFFGGNLNGSLPSLRKGAFELLLAIAQRWRSLSPFCIVLPQWYHFSLQYWIIAFILVNAIQHHIALYVLNISEYYICSRSSVMSHNYDLSWNGLKSN